MLLWCARQWDRLVTWTVIFVLKLKLKVLRQRVLFPFLNNLNVCIWFQPKTERFRPSLPPVIQSQKSTQPSFPRKSLKSADPPHPACKKNLKILWPPHSPRSEMSYFSSPESYKILKTCPKKYLRRFRLEMFRFVSSLRKDRTKIQSL